mmetsp:Transcript_88049/g.249554  ORF Transcript_88049/g.249554 Transcript_88049/m.249554 type:complete len:212 (-) Transcript_88049:124-759(-)
MPGGPLPLTGGPAFRAKPGRDFGTGVGERLCFGRVGERLRVEEVRERRRVGEVGERLRVEGVSERLRGGASAAAVERVGGAKPLPPAMPGGQPLAGGAPWGGGRSGGCPKPPTNQPPAVHGVGGGHCCFWNGLPGKRPHHWKLWGWGAAPPGAGGGAAERCGVEAPRVRSNLKRLSLSRSVAYASATSLNFSSACLSPGFLSGWYCSASFR